MDSIRQSVTNVEKQFGAGVAELVGARITRTSHVIADNNTNALAKVELAPPISISMDACPVLAVKFALISASSIIYRVSEAGVHEFILEFCIPKDKNWKPATYANGPPRTNGDKRPCGSSLCPME